MKKTNFLFTLFLCLTLLVSFASAETAAYVPGETTDALFADALDAGLMVGGEAQLTLKANPAMFDDDADLSRIDAMTDILNDVRAHRRSGQNRGWLPSGACRLVCAGKLHARGREPRAEPDIDGISIESNLLKGERVTAKWETLLALCGADDTMIAAVLRAQRDGLGYRAFLSLPKPSALTPASPRRLSSRIWIRSATSSRA